MLVILTASHRDLTCRLLVQNVDVERCQKGHQMDLLMLFRLLKQRYDTWEAELEGLGQVLF